MKETESFDRPRHRQPDIYFLARLVILTESSSGHISTGCLLFGCQKCPHAAILNTKVCSIFTTTSHPVKENASLQTTLVAQGSLDHDTHLLQATSTRMDMMPRIPRTIHTQPTRVTTTLPTSRSSSLSKLPMPIPMLLPLQRLLPLPQICLN